MKLLKLWYIISNLVLSCDSVNAPCSLVWWLSGSLDLSVRARNGGCGSGRSLTHYIVSLLMIRLKTVSINCLLIMFVPHPFTLIVTMSFQQDLVSEKQLV
jgi:hypothetical protein